MKRRYREGETSLIGTFGVIGLLAYLTGVVQGYIKGFTGEHRALKWTSRIVVAGCAAFAAVFVLVSIMHKPIFPEKEMQGDSFVAQAAEEQEKKGKSDEGCDADPPQQEESEEEKDPETAEEFSADEKEPLIQPKDDSIMEPTDVYAEKGCLAAFRAYHPEALDYQWEIQVEGQWEQVSEDAVTEKTDELMRKLSVLEVTADREKTVRCKVSLEKDPEAVYTVGLYILSGAVESISVDEFSAEAGKYVNTGEIPVEVTYHDGSREVVTGLSGLCFLETEESKESSETASGNIKETITTVRTSCDYNHLDLGTAKEIIGYRKQNGDVLEAAVNMKGIDLTAPVIKEVQISDFEVSNIDRPVAVTVSIMAEDNVTPSDQLTYAFLPKDAEVTEKVWREDSSFEAEITQNGIWTAYCRDAGGNVATKEQELIVVDNKAPVVTIILEQDSGWCRENKIYVSAEDSMPVEYRYICTASGADSGWTAESSKVVSENGTWTIQVRDAVGNTAEQEITIDNIDSAPPVIRRITVTEKTEGEAVKNEE